MMFINRHHSKLQNHSMMQRCSQQHQYPNKLETCTQHLSMQLSSRFSTTSMTLWQIKKLLHLVVLFIFSFISLACLFCSVLNDFVFTAWATGDTVLIWQWIDSHNVFPPPSGGSASFQLVKHCIHLERCRQVEGKA